MNFRDLQYVEHVVEQMPRSKLAWTTRAAFVRLKALARQSFDRFERETIIAAGRRLRS